MIYISSTIQVLLIGSFLSVLSNCNQHCGDYLQIMSRKFMVFLFPSINSWRLLLYTFLSPAIPQSYTPIFIQVLICALLRFWSQVICIFPCFDQFADWYLIIYIAQNSPIFRMRIHLCENSDAGIFGFNLSAVTHFKKWRGGFSVVSVRRSTSS